jgi:hypothetical protein
VLAHLLRLRKILGEMPVDEASDRLRLPKEIPAHLLEEEDE